MKFDRPTGVRGKAAWPLRRRLAEKTTVDAATGCWVWGGASNELGYGRVTYNGRCYQAHRLSYEGHVGPIPDGLVIDHLCRNPSCINPLHLEPVTNRENLLRGETITAANAAKISCPHGHEYSGRNLIILKCGGRVCRECKRLLDTARRNKEKSHAL